MSATVSAPRLESAPPANTPPPRSLRAHLEPIRPQMELVEAKLRSTDEDEFPLLHLVLDRVFGSGGKRMRPALAVLSSRLGPVPVDDRRSVALGAALETLHTASLVHDDLIDNAHVRRGLPTINAFWSPAATVLAGDFLFARAAVLITETDNVRVIARFSDTLRQLCDGELRQMFRNAFVTIPGLAYSLGLEYSANGNGHHVEEPLPGSVEAALAMVPTDEEYERRITGKTAALFATSAETGAILSGCTEAEISAARHYGLALGRAFQVVDDVLDFTSTEADLGKPVGSDLRQGHLTLPAMRFAQADPEGWRAWIGRIPQLVKNSEYTFGEAPEGSGKHSGTPAHEAAFQELIARIAHSDAIATALQRAEHYAREAQQALAILPDSATKALMQDLAEYAVVRTH
jgi:geranylgeranyl pyrophosphate synthase